MAAAAAATSASNDDGIIQESGVSASSRELEPSAMAMAGYPAPPPLERRRWRARVAQKLERWLFLYNVTTGLYMLDWWERCIFNAVFVVLFLLVGYNSGHYLQHVGARLVAWAWRVDSSMEIAGGDAGARAPGG